ncbi:MAG: response regulator [Actinobacteria bacterium]|nr:MAG: response regulator [Actinomycetota bacterium]
MNARILLVDDDTALLDALPEALRLRMNGIQIDTSETAVDALERIKQTDYDAIVSDVKMPGMDGLALLHEIRELRPSTPTLMITGHGERELAVQALRGGAYDFVQKPIDRDYFIASLERAIQRRVLVRQVEEQRLALERHARVLEHVDDGVFLVDDEGVIRHWNPAAEAITGIGSPEALGRRVEETLPGWEAVAPLIPVASVPRPGSVEAKVVPLEFDGRELWLSISGVTFSDGVVYAFRSLTEERALEELKGEFIATVSHELRTPLAAIYGSAQTLLREDIELDESGQKRLLDVIAQESERLSRIADDILFANKLDSGQFVLGEKRIDLLALAREVVDQMRACFASRDDISIDLAVPATIDSLVGDSDKLRQVLINLIDNAVKYSPDGGRIDVAVEARDGGVRISIRDEGIGIAPLEQRRIFGKFYRVDPALTRGVGGTGLGLYICRELVRRMEGRLSVRSEEGKGSTFIVELPVQAAGDSDRGAAVAQTA